MYTESIYIDINGSNETGNGSNTSPYATIEYALSKATTTNPAFYVGKGTFYITDVVSLTTANHTNNIIGTGLKTHIMVKVLHMKDSVGNLNVYKCIFQPIDDATGDELRALFYTPSSFHTMAFYNCLFLKSSNGKYPSNTILFGHANSTTPTGKSFYNCTSMIAQTYDYGSPVFKYCAFLNSASIIHYASVTDCKSNITGYNQKTYALTSDNTIYGVYSGENAWKFRKYLIYQNSKYYSIKEEYFNGETYNPLSSESIIDIIDSVGFNISELTTETTVSEKTFKPIDKFAGKLQLVSTDLFKLNINGLKSNIEMIVGKSSFSTVFANNIDYFKLSGDSIDGIKLAVSIDDGDTWKTYDAENTTFKDLEVTIPSSNYSDFSPTDITNWNAAKTKISTDGINASDMSSIDFNKLNSTKIKFAYVLTATSTTEMDSMKNLTWQFDAKGSLRQCTSDEATIEVNSNGVKITSNIDSDILKTNILYEGT